MRERPDRELRIIVNVHFIWTYVHVCHKWCGLISQYVLFFEQKRYHLHWWATSTLPFGLSLKCIHQKLKRERIVRAMKNILILLENLEERGKWKGLLTVCYTGAHSSKDERPPYTLNLLGSVSAPLGAKILHFSVMKLTIFIQDNCLYCSFWSFIV